MIGKPRLIAPPFSFRSCRGRGGLGAPEQLGGQFASYVSPLTKGQVCSVSSLSTISFCSQLFDFLFELSVYIVNSSLLLFTDFCAPAPSLLHLPPPHTRCTSLSHGIHLSSTIGKESVGSLYTSEQSFLSLVARCPEELPDVKVPNLAQKVNQRTALIFRFGLGGLGLCGAGDSIA